MSSTPRRALVAGVATLATVLPMLSLTSAPAEAANKHHHRARAGSQILRVILLDTTPGVPGGKIGDLRIGRAAGAINTRKAFPAISTAKTIGGRGLADTKLDGVLETTTVKANDEDKNPEPQSGSVLDLSMAAPLLGGQVSGAGVAAKWAGAKKCLPPAKAATRSTSTTTDLAVLPSGIPGVGDLLSLPGTASAVEKTRYVRKGKKSGLKSISTTGLADLSVFGGALNIHVVSDPKLVSTATGKAGKAKVAYTPAVLEITGGGQTFPVPTDGAPAEIAIPDNPLLGLTLQFPGVIKQKVSDNGKTAKAKAVTLRLVLSLAGNVIADVTVGALQAKATVPKGGISC